VVASSWPVWPWASVPLRPGSCPMQATKGAVKMFTQALSREVGSRGITINNVERVRWIRI
jgi:NAD(P)-dependent dehydrogenase (short-subunit alcohol dehydrogenase family)